MNKLIRKIRRKIIIIAAAFYVSFLWGIGRMDLLEEAKD